MPICLTHTELVSPGRTLFTLSFVVGDTIAQLRVEASTRDGVRLLSPADAWGRAQRLPMTRARPAPKQRAKLPRKQGGA